MFLCLTLQWGLGFLAEEGTLGEVLGGIVKSLQWGLGFLAEEGAAEVRMPVRTRTCFNGASAF